MDGWGKVKPASKYAGVSERTMRGDWFKAGLRHVRLSTGTVLIKYVWIDEFLERFEVAAGTDAEVVSKIVAEVCREL